MILTVGNIKGGVGKTTLAVNLAIARSLAGRDVLLIDADSQRSALDFTNLRTSELGAPGYTAVALDGADMRAQVRQLAPKYDDMIIDAGGRDSSSLRASLLVADVILIPIQPRSLDLWAIEQTAELVKDARITNPDLTALVVINAADSQGLDNDQAGAYVREEAKDLTLLSTTIGRRKAFANAIAQGRSVLEQSARDKDPKAMAELNELVAAVYTRTLVGA
jgi:chromosome partitioning protein